MDRGFTIDQALPELVLDAAGTAPPLVSRRLAESYELVAGRLLRAVARALQLAGANGPAPPVVSGHALCAAVLFHTPQAVEHAMRDALMQLLSSCLAHASEDEIGALGAVARCITARLLDICARSVAGAVGSLADRAVDDTTAPAPEPTSLPRRRGRPGDGVVVGELDTQPEHGGQQQQQQPAPSSKRLVVSLGCPRLDRMLHARVRGLLRGQVHELYGEAGCGKSTWAAQFMLHTLRQARVAAAAAAAAAAPSPPVTVLLLSAEPVSMARIEQVARGEHAQMLAQLREQQQQQQRRQPEPNSSGSGNTGVGDDWRDLLSGFLIVELRHVDHFEESVRMFLRDGGGKARTVPLVVLDSVAALVEKSLRGAGAANGNGSGGGAAAWDNNQPATDQLEKSEYVERVGAALRQLAWALDCAVLVVNQARWAGPEGERGIGGATPLLPAASSASSSATTASFQPALGHAWSTFVSGCSIELSRPPRDGFAPASRRRARLMRSSAAPPCAHVEYDLVAGGIADAPLC